MITHEHVTSMKNKPVGRCMPHKNLKIRKAAEFDLLCETKTAILRHCSRLTCLRLEQY